MLGKATKVASHSCENLASRAASCSPRVKSAVTREALPPSSVAPDYTRSRGGERSNVTAATALARVDFPPGGLSTPIGRGPENENLAWRPPLIVVARQTCEIRPTRGDGSFKATVGVSSVRPVFGRDEIVVFVLEDRPWPKYRVFPYAYGFSPSSLFRCRRSRRRGTRSGGDDGTIVVHVVLLGVPCPLSRKQSFGHRRSKRLFLVECVSAIGVLFELQVHNIIFQFVTNWNSLYWKVKIKLCQTICIYD